MLYRVTHYRINAETKAYPVPMTAWREGNTLFGTDGRAIAGLINDQWITISTIPLVPSMWTKLAAELVQ